MQSFFILKFFLESCPFFKLSLPVSSKTLELFPTQIWLKFQESSCINWTRILFTIRSLREFRFPLSMNWKIFVNWLLRLKKAYEQVSRQASRISKGISIQLKILTALLKSFLLEKVQLLRDQRILLKERTMLSLF